MYILRAEACMDAAHFLNGYIGKCGNIHGHRWKVVVSICGEELQSDLQERGMLVDFGQLKEELKEEVDYFDHMFIVEKDTLREETMEALKKEGFSMRQVEFRPTAENFSRYFYEKIENRGYKVQEVVVYETPNNCATYIG